MRMQISENRAIFAIIGLALLACVALAMLGDLAQSNTYRAKHIECGRSHYTKFEDGSGKLWCDGREVMRVNVPH